MPKPKKANDKPQDYLRLEKEHKDWYTPHYQGKSRGRPWIGAEPEKKKPKKKKK